MEEEGTTQRAGRRAPLSVTDLLAGRAAADPAQEPPGHADPAPAPPGDDGDDSDGDVPAPGDTPETADTVQLYVTELLRREGRFDEAPLPGRPSWFCRLVAALACFALLFGAALASTAALSGPRTERAAPSSAAPASIVGAEALRADLIDASIGLTPPSAPAAGQRAGDGPATPATGESAERPAPTVRSTPEGEHLPPPAQPAPPAATAAQERPSGPEVNPVLDTVTAFYENVAVAPRQAFALLDPQMRGSGYKEFRTGWTDVEQVTVDNIRLDGPNAAVVHVSLERSDGTVLHTLQRVLVTPGAEPRITDARLLSASRS